ncbi:sigma-70 region 2 [Sphingopyxis fribergensis]|uniref:Sigma-70 region 2 n=1 Tax=Sphingopyxis fribergensis TaxID=1515612 RepID=A0A0A7PMM3_9SPHN|nr:sigma factor [Sphingopyxis fribergensis]AJA11265.1 sigma-70 region 2 [Sphingopyxis fribergensis]
MSAKSDALEQAVTDYIQARTALEAAPGARTRALADRAFVRLAALAAPRIRYFTRTYGLADVADDAEQVCAIALHRAAERYDPARARFTTYINWQLRAELQALRHRLHGDQRCAGRRDVTAMLSLDALEEGGDDNWLVDPAAEPATEQGAADGLANLVAERLVAEWTARRRAGLSRACRADGDRIEARVAAEQALVRDQLMVSDAVERLRESDRHIVRRALADMVRHAGLKRPH